MRRCTPTAKSRATRPKKTPWRRQARHTVCRVRIARVADPRGADKWARGIGIRRVVVGGRRRSPLGQRRCHMPRRAEAERCAARPQTATAGRAMRSTGNPTGRRPFSKVSSTAVGVHQFLGSSVPMLMLLDARPSSRHRGRRRHGEIACRWVLAGIAREQLTLPVPVDFSFAAVDRRHLAPASARCPFRGRARAGTARAAPARATFLGARGAIVGCRPVA